MNDELTITDDMPSVEVLTELKKAEWYVHFVEELNAEIVETEHNIQNDSIRLNFSLGRQIHDKTKEFEQWQMYGQNVIKTISDDLRQLGRKSVSSIRLYKARQFFRFIEKEAGGDLDAWLAKQDKGLSWYRITKDILPEPKVPIVPSTPDTIESEPIDEKDETSKPSKAPILTPVWDEKTELWRIDIEDSELARIDVSLLQKRLDDYLRNL